MLRRFVLAIITRIDVHTNAVNLTLDRNALNHWLASDDQIEGRAIAHLGPAPDGSTLHLTVAASLRRAGNELRFVIAGKRQGNPDHSLIRLLSRAHRIGHRFTQEEGLTIEEVAIAEKLTPSYVTRLLRLTFLAPAILSRILDGDHPPELTAAKLMADTRLPLCWREQHLRLGFPA